MAVSPDFLYRLFSVREETLPPLRCCQSSQVIPLSGGVGDAFFCEGVARSVVLVANALRAVRISVEDVFMDRMS